MLTRSTSAGLRALLLVLGLLATGCGPNHDESQRPVSTEIRGEDWPRTVSRGAAGSFELAGPPRRILALNAGALDTLSLLTGPERLAGIARGGARYSVVLGRGTLVLDSAARDLGSDSESILALEPDLVVMHAWQTLEQLAIFEHHSVPWLALPDVRDFDDLTDSVSLLGRALGEEARAASVVQDLARRRSELEPAREAGRRRALAYTNDGAGGYAMGPGSTQGLVIELAGLLDAGAQLGRGAHFAIDLETLLTLDPELLVIAAAAEPDQVSPTRRTLEQDRRFAALRAVAEGRVFEIPARLFSTNSPFLLDAAEGLAREVRLAFDQ